MSTPAKPTSVESYKRLLSYAFKYKAYFIISFIGFGVFAAMEAQLINILEYFVDRLEGRPSAPVLGLSADVTSSLWFVPISVVVLSIIRGIGAYFGNFYMSLVGLNVITNLRRQIFSQMIYLPQSFYDTKNSGELISLLVYNIEQVTGSVTNAVKTLFRDGMSVAWFLAMMLIINWKLTLAFICVAPVLGGLMYIASKYFRKVSHKIQSAVGRVSHVATESIQGIKLVKSYGGEKYELDRFNDATNQNLHYGTKFERVSAFQTPVLHIVLALALAVTFYLIMILWDSDSSKAVVYATYAAAIAKPFRQLTKINSIIQKGLAAADTIFEVLDLQAEPNSGQQKLNAPKGRVELKDVHFGYNQDTPALNGISFAIEPGQTVALVGSSGSGKSTIVSLLLRFYDNQQGSITIDGTPIQSLELHNLREHIALVNQQTILFNDTIAANIAYGSEHIDEARIQDAAKQANAHDFIMALPNGYQTPAGEDGSRLSGGQRQRIAIARALYKNAPILILDEATSALDNESEKQIQSALDELKQGRTTLVIAHRLSTIENADTILVMDNGRIVEAGNHQTLLDRSGVYANLYHSQFS
ncbi:lipid A export permease/ATP-binding protein MsbA [Saccharophagus degradans]|uniref:ATP-dependent lipid A-core flippase n=1 Tax=Saccharophagus degradans (strain 2-40 / ATCC 43961 / DSM 17024) TaxID=203122 RepID=MSBA_SACD2|nr:lipid A export permease/ATP-binding protein MsbA [Saccharophagus degradans]Q21NS8.1 RecName: Full=ATP-dependent lipid A-core flippase; AltName: Full=Lipid A export ATP-binding/permease protein MsbA [Saccharophagus degradans 2-40]ABD79651.1 Lipid A export ATP-binding/permease protein MsbA [Saccharophagus degradans 2-40]